MMDIAWLRVRAATIIACRRGSELPSCRVEAACPAALQAFAIRNVVILHAPDINLGQFSQVESSCSINALQ